MCMQIIKAAGLHFLSWGAVAREWQWAQASKTSNLSENFENLAKFLAFMDKNLVLAPNTKYWTEGIGQALVQELAS